MGVKSTRREFVASAVGLAVFGCRAFRAPSAEARLSAAAEAPFTRYLPEHVLGDGCRLTSVDLATHSSGYENLEELRDGIGKYADRSEFLRKCLLHRPAHARHWKYRYCCQNYIYLGFILEAITGKSLDVACRELVFEPLGMRDTSWGPTSRLRLSEGIWYNPRIFLLMAVRLKVKARQTT